MKEYIFDSSIFFWGTVGSFFYNAIFMSGLWTLWCCRWKPHWSIGWSILTATFVITDILVSVNQFIQYMSIWKLVLTEPNVVQDVWATLQSDSWAGRKSFLLGLDKMSPESSHSTPNILRLTCSLWSLWKHQTSKISCLHYISVTIFW